MAQLKLGCLKLTVKYGSAYPFLQRSGSIETNPAWRPRQLHHCLSISAKKWLNWNINAFFALAFAASNYPFLQRSGSIETSLELTPRWVVGCYPFLQRSGSIETPDRCSPGVIARHLSISAKKWLNWNAFFEHLRTSSSCPIHFCKEVAQLKREIYDQVTGLDDLSISAKKWLNWNTKWGNGSQLIAVSYPFLQRSGSIETSRNLFTAIKNLSLSISAKKWLNWNPTRSRRSPPKKLLYPFLQRSGSIETLQIIDSGQLVRMAIHFCKEVAQLKRCYVCETSSIIVILSISAKKWLNWNYAFCPLHSFQKLSIHFCKEVAQLKRVQ